VLGVIAAANRDPQQFDHANRLDLARSTNRHLSFGEGGHYCLGAALARMEAGVAFAQLLERFPALSLAEPRAGISWRGGVVLRGVRRLRVSG
jgi:cytochrome P450